MAEISEWISPNQVTHIQGEQGPCWTCGNDRHELPLSEYAARLAEYKQTIQRKADAGLWAEVEELNAELPTAVERGSFADGVSEPECDGHIQPDAGFGGQDITRYCNGECADIEIGG